MRGELVIAVDEFALGTLEGVEAELTGAGAAVIHTGVGLPDLDGRDGLTAAVIGGPDVASLAQRLQQAGAGGRLPLIAALPRGTRDPAGLRGPGVVDWIPAETRQAGKRILAMASVPVVSVHRPRPAPAGRHEPAQGGKVIGIASSTGGAWVLCGVLSRLDHCHTVLLAQHLDAPFVPSFATWLSRVSGWPVTVIEETGPLTSGAVLMARGGCDLLVEGARVCTAPASARSVPSADRLFASLARSVGPGAAAVVLSGMGSDGARGLAEIVQRGGRALCQHPSTAIVRSMPQQAMRAVPRALALHPEELAAALSIPSPQSVFQRDPPGPRPP